MVIYELAKTFGIIDIIC